MANQNLSQFGEKLFVADADHTFIWDTAASISKRVSRNSWLNSGTLTSDAPVTISQTWNGTGSTVFTALKVNATTPGTTSSSSSLLLDLQVGGVSTFKVDRSGSVTLSYASGLFISPSNRVRLGNNSTDAVEGLFIGNTSYIGFINGANSNLGSDSKLYGESLNTLALRNGAAAQTFNIYNTYQNAGVDYERIAFKWSANLFTIGREFGGTGLARNINIIGGGSVLGIGSAATAAVSWTFSFNHFLAGTDNTYNIGANGASRPQNIFVGQTVRANAFQLNSLSHIYGTVEGIIGLYNNALSDFNRLQFGGATDAFPAVARDGAGIKFTGAAAGSTAWIKVPPVAVSALPLAATAGAGARAFVNDASSPTFGSAVTGGGAVLVPVYSTGSAWHVG